MAARQLVHARDAPGGRTIGQLREPQGDRCSTTPRAAMAHALQDRRTRRLGRRVVVEHSESRKRTQGEIGCYRIEHGFYQYHWH
jgi:hypothetical protein